MDTVYYEYNKHILYAPITERTLYDETLSFKMTLRMRLPNVSYPYSLSRKNVT